MQGYIEWLCHTPMITNSLTMLLCVYIAVMAIYSVVYVAFDSNRGAMTNPLAAILYGVFVGGPALIVFLGLFYCWSVLL